MKLTRPGVTHFSLALLLALCAAPACNGDDSTPVGTGGSAPEAGPDSAGGAGGSAGLGGSAGGSANTGGQVGTGGSSGAGGSAGNDGSAGGDASVGDARSDVTADVRSDVSATTDASDASRSDASDAAIVDAAPEASAGPCPVLAGDGGDAGDGGVHYQLYSFSGATSTADLAAWSTFMMGPVVSSTDDSTPESSTPGSLHATITYSGYNTFPVLESYHAVPLDFSCFTRLHISVKFT
ncbi:MAG TPA: hypothetical protein VGL13_14715, partial [Polyangiaceae bacterium]